MQTCPHCHNVLVAPTCCSGSFTPHGSTPQQVPMFFTVAPGHLHSFSSVPHQHHQPSSLPTASTITHYGEFAKESARKMEEERVPPPHLSSLPTPHVSGHMFHFPSVVNNDLAHRLSACQVTCHINCLTHGTLLGPSVPCRTDNSFQHTPLRQSNSWGLPVTSSVDLQPLSGVEEDKLRLESSKRVLKMSDWYWAQLTWQEAEVLLQSTSVGTFLVRNSADPNHRFSLSVQTEKGPTSVRINLSRGKYRLKCETSVKSSLPEFSCVVKLIEYYVSSNDKYNHHVWVDAAGKVYSPIRISHPLYKSVPSLKHLSRKVVNFSFSKNTIGDKLPTALLKYIDEYPYWC